MEQRYELIKAVDDGMTVAGACRLWGISRETYYVWRKRFEEEGVEGLVSRSSKPKHSPSRLTWSIETDIVEMRKAHSRWGARRIRTELKRKGLKVVPAVSTTHEVLVRNGLITQEPKAPKALQRFERKAPGELWQTDAKDVVLLLGEKVHVFSLLDDHSRLCCAAEACDSLEAGNAIAAFDVATDRYGLPYSTLTDRGSTFTGRTTKTVGPFERHLWNQGVFTINGAPYHPQTQGKIERYHRTLGEWLEDNGPFATLETLQASLDAFRHDYNELRPHQGIGDITPAERWAATPRRSVDFDGTKHRRVRESLRKCDAAGKFTYGDWSIRMGVTWAKSTVKLVDFGHIIELRDEHGVLIQSVHPDLTKRVLAPGRKPGRPSIKSAS